MNDDLTSAEGSAMKEGLRVAIAHDDERASLPFEHGGTLLASLGFAVCGLRARGRAWTLLHGVVAGALLWRSLSGRDGLRRWADAPRARSVEQPYRDTVPEGPPPGGPL